MSLWRAFRSLLFPFSEDVTHVDSALLQHLVTHVGVDVGGGLVVCVTDDLHGDQRVDAGLIEHGHVVVSEVMRRDKGLDALQDVVRATGIGLLLTPFDAVRSQHQPAPKSFEGRL